MDICLEFIDAIDPQEIKIKIENLIVLTGRKTPVFFLNPGTTLITGNYYTQLFFKNYKPKS